MILLNFSLPLAPEQVAKIEHMLHLRIERVIELSIYFQENKPFVPQFHEAFLVMPFSPDQWQTLPLLVNLPPDNYTSVLIMAELHRRMGYVAPFIRLKPMGRAGSPYVEVVKIVNLQ